jgi:hypothetical protein
MTTLSEEITVSAEKLANFAYHCLADLMDGDLGNSTLSLSAVEDAEVLVKIQKCLAQKASIILLRIEYKE